MLTKERMKEFRSVPVRQLHEANQTSESSRVMQESDANGIDSTTPPKATRQTPARSPRPQAIVNLENFETVAVHPKTVFNSPRSLRVCAELGVHATELLPRSPHDFLAPNVPETIAAIRYHHFESRRQEKLGLLRSARAEMIGISLCQMNAPDAHSRQERPQIAQTRRVDPSVLEKVVKRELVYERALRAKREKEQQVIQRQLLNEQRAAAHRRACEEEKLKVIEMRRLRWNDTRENIEHKRRQQEFELRRRSESTEARHRPTTKWDLIVAKEAYFTPRQREEKKRATSATR